MSKKAFIIGGGQIGGAIARILLEQGWQVVIGSRSSRRLSADLLQRGLSVSFLDRADPGALSRSVGEGADMIVDTIAYDAVDADQLLAIASAGNVGAFLVISSASVYRDDDHRTLDEAPKNGFPLLPEPITESQPTVEPGPATYSTRKVALERRMLDRAPCPTTILRPCAIYGIGSRHPREWWFVKRLLDGRTKIPIAYAGTSQFHTSATANIAALAAVIADRPTTAILNSVDPQALSVTEIGIAVMAAAGLKADMIEIGDADYPPKIGATPWSVPRPFVLSDEAARQIGYTPVVDYPIGVVPVCRWMIETAAASDWRTAFPVFASYPSDPFDYAAEDRCIAQQ